MTARIDCNRGRGTLEESSGASQLELGPLALTRAKCPERSLHDWIVKQWATHPLVRHQRRAFVSVPTMADGGIYEFEPVAAGQTPLAGQTGRTVVKGTATFRERMALPPNAVFEAQLEDVSRIGRAG